MAKQTLSSCALTSNSSQSRQDRDDQDLLSTGQACNTHDGPESQTSAAEQIALSHYNLGA